MNLTDLVEQYDRLKRTDLIDLSKDQDLAIAIMNLIGIEEHLFFSGAKTGKHNYYDLIEEVRELRKHLLKRLIPEYEGEVWCISKHLLAASYRLMEVGTKLLHQQNQEEAYQHFEQAFKLYTLFWGINLKLIAPNEANQETDDLTQKHEANLFLNLPKKDQTMNNKEFTNKSWFSKITVWVKEKLNCCKE